MEGKEEERLAKCGDLQPEKPWRSAFLNGGLRTESRMGMGIRTAEGDNAEDSWTHKYEGQVKGGHSRAQFET